MNAIAELVNLANGSAAAGDNLAAKICRDAITEIERLQLELDLNARRCEMAIEKKTARTWRDRCQELADELRQQRARGPVRDETIEFLLDSSETLLTAAKCLIDMPSDKVPTQ